MHCRKKGGRVGSKGKSLRELLAEEEDDSLDFSVWNPTTNFVIESNQNMQQRTVKPVPISTSTTADESQLAFEG